MKRERERGWNDDSVETLCCTFCASLTSVLTGNRTNQQQRHHHHHQPHLAKQTCWTPFLYFLTPQFTFFISTPTKGATWLGALSQWAHLSSRQSQWCIVNKLAVKYVVSFWFRLVHTPACTLLISDQSDVSVHLSCRSKFIAVKSAICKSAVI